MLSIGEGMRPTASREVDAALLTAATLTEVVIIVRARLGHFWTVFHTPTNGCHCNKPLDQ
jgi:hypothetical protein